MDTQFQTMIEEATDVLMRTSGGDGKVAIARATAMLCEQGADFLLNLRIASEVCKKMGEEPVLPITQDIADSSDRISTTMAIICTLMIRNVLGLENVIKPSVGFVGEPTTKDGGGLDIDQFLDDQADRSRKLN